jgi:hypothetical protein
MYIIRAPDRIKNTIPNALLFLLLEMSEDVSSRFTVCLPIAL